MVRKNLNGIDDYIMGQVLGVSQNDIERDDLHKDLYCVSNHKRETSIVETLKNFNLRSNYNKNLIKFVEALIVGNNLPLNINKIKKWNNDQFELFNKITHYDFWHYRIKLFREGLLIIKDKPKKEKKPLNWGFGSIDSSANEFLNNLPILSANKAHAILINTDKYEVHTFINCCEKIEDILDYKDLIFKNGTLLNKLFNIKEEGSGKGEVLVAFLMGGKVMGNSVKYDVLSDDAKRIEVKAPQKSASFRFGTKASVGNYEFFSNILDARSVLINVTNQLENFSSLVNNDFNTISQLLLAEGDYTKERALSTALDSAELNQDRFNLIKLWFFLAHVTTHQFNRTNSIKQDIFSNKYIPDSGNKNDIINALRSLKYVENPLNLSEDIEREIEECFVGIDYLIIFKEDEKNETGEISICTSPSEIMIDSISQNGIKVIEKKHRYREDYLKTTFYLWKENKQLDFYDLYVDVKSGVLIEC